MHLLRHAGLIPHPDVVPMKVGNLLKDWVQVFTGNPGSWIPAFAGMTILMEAAICKQTLIRRSRRAPPS